MLSYAEVAGIVALVLAAVGLLLSILSFRQKLRSVRTQLAQAELAAKPIYPPLQQHVAFGSSPLDQAPLDINALAQTAIARAMQQQPVVTTEVVEVEPRKRRLQVLTRDATSYLGAKSGCVKCFQWDHDEGLAKIAEHPAFMQVCSALTPNQQMTRHDVDGKVIEEGTLPSKLNTWELFGYCPVTDRIIHATDVCENYTSRAEMAQ